MKKLFIVFTSLFIVVIFFSGLTRAAIAQDGLPTRADLAEGWNEVFPGGDTICSRGTEFSFFVRPAETEKVMIYFQGGGACWNSDMCAPGSGIFSEDVPEDEVETKAIQGIFDFDNAENPVADYNIVYVPYCTGDIHTGNRTATYEVEGSDPIVVEHKGFVNSSAAMAWMFENYPSPEKMLVTGCSAGGFGAIFAAPFVMEHYAEMQVIEFSDSAVGVAKAEWDGVQQWGSYDSLPESLAGLKDLTPDHFVPQLYVETAQLNPDDRLGLFTTTRDQVMTGFYLAMLGFGWEAQMEATLTSIQEGAPDNFRSYVAGGSEHCILPLDRFYSYASDGVRFVEWFTDYINNEAVDNVHCEDCSVAEEVMAEASN